MEIISSEIFQNLISALILAIVAIVVFFLRVAAQKLLSYLEVKMGVDRLEELKMFAQTTVRFLEQNQIFAKLDGAAKKERAIISILEYCSDRKIPVDRDLIDKLIEESVQIMNTEMGKLDLAEMVKVGE